MLAAAKQLPVLAALDVEAAYREHAGFVWANLRRFGVGAEQLEDAMHDVFVVVHRRAAHFDPSRSSLTTWVFGIVRRVAADTQRGRDRGRRKLDAYRADTYAREQTGQASRAELRVILADLLSAVDEEAAQIFVSSQLHGVPLHEIAQDMGLNRNTVASRLRVTRRRLRELSGGHSSGPRAAERTLHALRSLDEEDGSVQMPAPVRHRVLAGLLPLWSTPVSVAPVSASASASPASAAAGLLLKRLLVAGLLPSLGLAVWFGVSRSSTEPSSRLAAGGETLSEERRQHRPRPGADLRPTLEDSDTASSPTPTTAAPAGPLAASVPAGALPPRRARHHSEASAPTPGTGATTSERPGSPSPRKASPKASPKALAEEQLLRSTLRAELSLVTQARSSVRAGKPALALTLAREHAMKFDGGVLGVEIDLIAVDALCRLGRKDEAEAKARALSAGKARALSAGALDPSKLASICD